MLESKFIGKKQDQLQLKFLHVSRAYRKNGLGKSLFERSANKARELGARWLYISATPSENTVNFYLRLGCRIAQAVDPELFELEPEDIHLEYGLYGSEQPMETFRLRSSPLPAKRTCARDKSI